MLVAFLVAVVAFLVSSSAATCSKVEDSLSAACGPPQHEVGLLQHRSLALHGAHHASRGKLSESPFLSITSFTDSECTIATGAEANISLEGAEACLMGFSYSCSCQGSSKVVIAKFFESAACNASEPHEEHVLPLSTCLSGEQTSKSSKVFQIVTDHGSCPCCGASCTDSSDGQESLLAKRERERVRASKKARTSAPMTELQVWYAGSRCDQDHRRVPHDFDLVLDYESIQFGYKWGCGCSAGGGKVLRVFRVQTEEYFEVPNHDCYQLTNSDCRSCVNVWYVDLSACPPAGQATCTVHGDPHITVFDQAEVLLLGMDKTLKQAIGNAKQDADDEFGWGDFWLIKSEQVQVQGRYRKVYYPKASQPLNHTYLTSVAISGPFMRGHTLIVEPRSGSVVWTLAGGSRKILDSQEEAVMGREAGEADDEDFTFEQEDLIKAIYSDRTPIVPQHSQGLVRGLDVELPSNVKLLIDRFGKHLDMRIEMAAAAGGAGGVDGQCGNFNGDPTDDTAELIGQRFGHQVPAEDLLFSS